MHEILCLHDHWYQILLEACMSLGAINVIESHTLQKLKDNLNQLMSAKFKGVHEYSLRIDSRLKAYF